MSNSLLEYGELFKDLGLTELSVEDGDFKLCLTHSIRDVNQAVRYVNREFSESPEWKYEYGNNQESGV